MFTNVVYTDGSCVNNGKANATGGLGIYIKSSCFGNDIKMNKKGETMYLKLKTIDDKYYVTNIRMEGIAIIASMYLFAEHYIFNKQIINPVNYLNNHFLKGEQPFKVKYEKNELKEASTCTEDTIEIVTDSKFWIDMIEEKMPRWVIAETALLKARKNKDLILIFIYYITLFKQNNLTIKFTHVYSHNKRARNEHNDGNEIADELAEHASKNNDTKFYQK